jgi:hypothetical protein
MMAQVSVAIHTGGRMKDRYFGAHEFQAGKEVVTIFSERSFWAKLGHFLHVVITPS